jgi:MFS family permease
LSATSEVSALAPFKVRSFRFQWPADLATSWAFEMETLILGWYVLVETGSVVMLTVFASLLYIGTLLAPMFGVMGDRIGHRNLLCAMRGLYAALAAILMTFAFMGIVTPALVLAITAVMGLVRPSDIGMRAALVAETMPADRMVGAMSIQRTTQDTARIAGALTGAGLLAALGMGPAYMAVSSFYAISVLLTLKAGSARPAHHLAKDAAGGSARPRDTSSEHRASEAGATTRSPQTAGSAGNESARPRDTSSKGSASEAGATTRSPQTAGSAGNESARPRDTSSKGSASEAGATTRSPQTAGSAGNESARPSPWRELREGLAYVWNTPHLLGAMSLAFLLNLTAFPMFTGLLPYVAKEVYLSDQTTLGYMVAGASFGALLGSMALSRIGHAVRPARMGIIFGAGWYAMLLVFAHTPHAAAGIVVLILTGVVQSIGLIPMTAMLLRNSDVRYRGRVMGIRMLVLYGNLPGLLISAPLIARIGYPMTATLYCTIGLAFTLLIAVYWRAHLWRLGAPANAR